MVIQAILHAAAGVARNSSLAGTPTVATLTYMRVAALLATHDSTVVAMRSAATMASIVSTEGRTVAADDLAMAANLSSENE